MQTKQENRNTDTEDAAYRLHQSSSPLPVTEARGRHRKIRLAFSLPRRRPCLTRRGMLAALRAAEYAEWTASGGDFLSSMHQPIA